jgi:hypothetical protein
VLCHNDMRYLFVVVGVVVIVVVPNVCRGGRIRWWYPRIRVLFSACVNDVITSDYFSPHFKEVHLSTGIYYVMSTNTATLLGSNEKRILNSLGEFDSSASFARVDESLLASSA